MIHKNWAELIKPTQLVVKPGPDAARTATVIAEPLERGPSEPRWELRLYVSDQTSAVEFDRR